MFSRGLMGGAYEWVLLPDGYEVGNIIGLCHEHHTMITDNKTAITYRNGVFYWEDNSGLSQLQYQPPAKNQATERHSSLAEEVVERAVCKGCGRKMPRPKIEKDKMEPKKPRSTWSVAVPVDHRENGAEVIDELLTAAEDKLDQYGLHWGEGGRVAYFKLTTVLALFVTHADEILGNQ